MKIGTRSYYKGIRPYVEKELTLAKLASAQGHKKQAFKHLENAHILGQASTLLHTKVHILMLVWAVRYFDFKEGIGQILRIVGAATKTAIGFVPSGNTGGSNVSPFKVLPIPANLQTIIQQVKKQT